MIVWRKTSKKLRDRNKDSFNSEVKSVENEDNLFFVTKDDEVTKIKWVINFAISKYICRDQDMFDT